MGYGGAVLADSTCGRVAESAFTLNRVNVSKNNGNTGGGGLAVLGGGYWEITRTVFADNDIWAGPTWYSGFAAGGGLHVQAAHADLRNLLLVANVLDGSSTAYYGGGLYVNGGTVMLENSTICKHNQQGIYNASGAGHEILNTIFFENTADIEGIAAGNVWHSRSASLTDGVQGNIVADPLFADWAMNDFRLQKTSPCVNAGTKRVWMTDAVDLAGNPRVLARIPDMGAYEVIPIGGGLIMIR